MCLTIRSTSPRKLCRLHASGARRARRISGCAGLLALALLFLPRAWADAPPPAPPERGGSPAVVGGDKPAAQRPGGASVAPPEVQRAPLDPRIDQILTRLEARQMKDLAAKLSWQDEAFPRIGDPPQRKTGRIWYLQAQPVAKFMIHFTQSENGARAQEIQEYHVFDGIWYIEGKSVDGDKGTLSKYQVRRESDPDDPYKIGRGIFPLPFGQKKADVLREFELSLAAPAKGDPADTDHLVMIPRADTRSAEWYQDVHFWVAREGKYEGLPMQVRASKINGTGAKDSEITIRFDDVIFDKGIEPERFDFKPPAGWALGSVEALPPLPEKK